MPKKLPAIKLTCEVCFQPFTVQPYRAATAKTCSAKCRNTRASRVSAADRGNQQRFKGSGKSYPKFHGRHLHRIVAEAKLGRSLLPGEIVHHKDKNKQNAAPSNLKVTTQSNHVRIHFKEMMQARKLKAGF